MNIAVIVFSNLKMNMPIIKICCILYTNVHTCVCFLDEIFKSTEGKPAKKKYVNKQQNEVLRIRFVAPLAYFEHKIKR